jgi:hypothetical protein
MLHYHPFSAFPAFHFYISFFIYLWLFFFPFALPKSQDSPLCSGFRVTALSNDIGAASIFSQHPEPARLHTACKFL